MKFAYKILNVALPALMLMLSACSDGPDAPVPTPDEDGGEGTYLEVTLGQPVVSRSNPSGGEAGDGSEVGKDNENAIHTLALFIYNDTEGRGVNDNPQTPFVKTVFLDETALNNAEKTVDANNPNSITYKFKIGKFTFAENLRIAVVLNTKSGTHSIMDVKNLGELRTRLLDQSYSKAANVNDCSWFVMSNAYNTDNHPNDGKLHMPDVDKSLQGTKDHPLTGEVSVERLAARIDIMLTGGAELLAGSDGIPKTGGSAIHYQVKESPGIGGAERVTANVYITHIIPLNVMQKPSYAFKHVTTGEDIPSDISYYDVCGNEKMGANGITTNYVVDPNTLKKNGTISASDLGTWFGATGKDNVYQLVNDINTAYDNNNLTFNDYTRWDRVLPTSIGDWFDTNSDVPGSKSAILTYANENTVHKDMLDKPTNGTDVLTGLVLRVMYAPTVVYKAFNATTYELTVDDDYAPKFNNVTRVAPAGPNVTDADCYYFSDWDAAVAFKNAYPDKHYELTYFEKSICYYTVWIRHARPDDKQYDRRIPMEYGVVRNNIYRVGFTFHGPGSTEVIDREPEHLQTRIFLRPWRFIRHPEIIM